MFKAIIVNKAEDDTIYANLSDVKDSQLPEEGDVTIEVHYSDVNFKDGLCLSGKGRLVREYPHIPGIDFSGIVLESKDPRFKPGDKVINTGWRVGEVWFGGYSQKAKVKADWLVPLPESMSLKNSMAIGTAGLSAMLGIIELEDNGMKPDSGPVLVTGATGGVGSIAVAVLAFLGYEVACVTGNVNKNTPFLKDIGATKIIERKSLAEPSNKTLESAVWGGCIDTVGGIMLARILAQMKHETAVAAIGNAGDSSLPASVIPFLLRGIKLIGIDSASKETPKRIRAWERLSSDLPTDMLDLISTEITLSEVIQAGKDILAGNTFGRLVVNVKDA